MKLCAAAGEQLVALDEERAPLVEDRLERREVHDRRIRFDLAEVGIDRRVQREVRPEPVLEIAAGAPADLVVERISRVRRSRDT